MGVEACDISSQRVPHQDERPGKVEGANQMVQVFGNILETCPAAKTAAPAKPRSIISNGGSKPSHARLHQHPTRRRRPQSRFKYNDWFPFTLFEHVQAIYNSARWRETVAVMPRADRLNGGEKQKNST